jgi:hypothetical protein
MAIKAGVLAAFALTAAAAACGDDLRGFEPWLLEPVAAADGFWVRTPEFDVAAGEELQDCYFFQVPAGAGDVMVDRFTLALNPGSHHMNVFRVSTLRDLRPQDGEPVDLGGVTGTVLRGGPVGSSPCWKSGNWSDWPLVANSQQSTADQPVLDWRLPAGVATRFTPGEWLMLQIHFVNATTQETPYRGRGGVNFHRSHDGDTEELGTLFATQQSIRICRSSPVQRYAGSCSLPDGVHTVAAANGHFHSRGTRFSIYAWDGRSTEQPPDAARFYQSSRWAEPEMATGLAVPLPEGGGVWWTCEYQWQEPLEGCAAVDARDPQHAGDCCFTFGPTVETSEHCNVFVYYYPKAEDVTCF